MSHRLRFQQSKSPGFVIHSDQEPPTKTGMPSSEQNFLNFTAVFADFLRWWRHAKLMDLRRPLMARARPQGPSPLWCCPVPPLPVTLAPVHPRPLSLSSPNPLRHHLHLYHTLLSRSQLPMYPKHHLKAWSLRPQQRYPHLPNLHLFLPRNEASSHACSVRPLQRLHQTDQVSTSIL